MKVRDLFVVAALAFGASGVSLDADGKWRVDLEPLAASKEGRVLEVVEHEEGLLFDTVTDAKRLSDVLVGEVWYVSGQSNAECPLWNNIKDGNNPRFRDGNGGLVAQMTYRPFVRMCYASDYRTSDTPREEAPFAASALRSRRTSVPRSPTRRGAE